MKVLSIGMDWFSENPGGLPRYFSDYLHAWRMHGDDVRALVRWSHETQRDALPKYVHGLPLKQSGLWSVRQAWKRRIQMELSGEKYDLLNPHFAYYAWGAMSDSVLRDTPVVSHFHGPWAYESRVESKGLFREARFRIQKIIEKRVYHRSDQFIVLSQAFRQVLIDDYGIPGDRVHVIPGGVDIERFHPTTDRERVRRDLGLPQDGIILLSVRRLAHRMGLDRLLHAVSKLSKDFPRLLLVIVGTGELESQLRSLVQELDLEDHVRFVGRVSDSDLPKYYQAADLSVVPSVAFEGFGLITTESLACGTPVVGSPVGGTKEILQGLDPGLLVKSSGTGDLMQGLGALLSDMRRLPSRQQCKDYILENYTWDVIIPQIRQVFEVAAKGKRPASTPAPPRTPHEGYPKSTSPIR